MSNYTGDVFYLVTTTPHPPTLFASESEAHRVVKSFPVWAEASLTKVAFYTSSDCYLAIEKNERISRTALSKLTDEEKSVLGIS